MKKKNESPKSKSPSQLIDTRIKELGDWRGEMYDYHLDVQYRWRKNFAVGLGYSSIESDLLIDGTPGGQFNLKTDGPELFFRASF